MTKFMNGPAAGVVLGLRRAPLYLRAVQNRFAEKAEWDALDMLTDRPDPNERIVAYRRTKYDGHVHVCRRPSGSGYFAMAEYVVGDPQRADDVLRNTSKWQAWAEAQALAQAENGKGT